jgi:hypothetical protein
MKFEIVARVLVLVLLLALIPLYMEMLSWIIKWWKVVI